MQLLTILSFFILSLLCLAQDSPKPPSSPCQYSCPLFNTLRSNPWPLVKREGAIGWDSHYTIFDCVYAVPSSQSDLAISEWKCSYDKRTGLQALAAAGDNCPPRALQCPSSSDPHAAEPQFSHMENVEVLPWVENGRFLLYLMEHHPS
ncbi:hypothetical protein D9613_006625 [Agrocybe pediades]|uniref:Uncharacterized protein n=1 Tax=Agrocybe pediades TaxID=84607 RepID=A0A8H4QHN9_9AGAR|nr:hypothetical protein D9613_006625 [Agrocybe pediades]KAF9554959.1 hypothetical protein CPC08DRAFT_712427 [Agrocybe pediades]